MSELKQAIMQEYAKCISDPVYFMKKYCYIQHPTKGRMSFNLYPFQETVLRLFQKNDYSIVLKSRQLGISTLVAGYSTWLILFHKDKNILCIATKQETAKNMVTKVRFMYENLPSWLKGSKKPLEDNRLSLKLPNGSQVKAVSAAGDAGRSEAVSLLIMDEAAFIDNAFEIWTSAQQTLATGGGAILLSTPNGTGNFFHKTWNKAELGENKFLPIRLPWSVHPERNESWRQEQDELLGPKYAAQECDCDFTTSGDTVFLPELIKWYEETFIKDPLEKRGYDQGLWVWEPADFSRTYMVVADVARGDGKDYSAFHIVDIESCAQVAEYKGHITTKDYGNLLVSIATEYNDALLVVENANVGWAAIQQIIDRDYRNLYYSPKSDAWQNSSDSFFSKIENNDNMVPGFTTSLKNRPLIIGKYDAYVKEKQCIIRSRRLIDEMKTFIWKNGRPEAQSGYNDDLVMSWGIGLFVRDTALKFRQQGLDLSRAALNNFHTNHSIGLYNNNLNQDNPWQMNINGQNEDFSWVL